MIKGTGSKTHLTPFLKTHLTPFLRGDGALAGGGVELVDPGLIALEDQGALGLHRGGEEAVVHRPWLVEGCHATDLRVAGEILELRRDAGRERFLVERADLRLLRRIE